MSFNAISKNKIIAKFPNLQYSGSRCSWHTLSPDVDEVSD